MSNLVLKNVKVSVGGYVSLKAIKFMIEYYNSKNSVKGDKVFKYDEIKKYNQSHLKIQYYPEVLKEINLKKFRRIFRAFSVMCRNPLHYSPEASIIFLKGENSEGKTVVYKFYLDSYRKRSRESILSKRIYYTRIRVKYLGEYGNKKQFFHPDNVRLDNKEVAVNLITDNSRIKNNFKEFGSCYFSGNSNRIQNYSVISSDYWYNKLRYLFDKNNVKYRLREDWDGKAFSIILL